MKRTSIIHAVVVSTLSLIQLSLLSFAAEVSQRYSIQKPYGEILLTYKSFADFLASDRSYAAYQQIMFANYPELTALHSRRLTIGAIEQRAFQHSLKNYSMEQFNSYTSRLNEAELEIVFQEIITSANQILAPQNNKTTKLVLFLPYNSIFVIPGEMEHTIYASLKISPQKYRKLLAHEYSHLLHMDRKPKEGFTLARELVSEGLAVYLTLKILTDLTPQQAIPFMPKRSFEWCNQNEQLIKSQIKTDLLDSSNTLMANYFADGKVASPPVGFVEKTGYYIGYKIIEAAINKGYRLEQIAALDSSTVISISGYFN